MRRNNIADMTITEQIEKVKEDICDEYCKYPEQTRKEHKDAEEAYEALLETGHRSRSGEGLEGDGRPIL